MDKKNIKYFVLGILFVIIIFVFISANSVNEKEVGRYQISNTEQSTYIVDTKTGIVKRAYGSGSDQLGIPFDEMDKK